MSKLSSSLNMLNPANRLRGPNLITMRTPDQLRRIGRYAHQCYMCKRAELATGHWDMVILNPRNVTHGLCPKCQPREMERVRREAAEVRNQYEICSLSVVLP